MFGKAEQEEASDFKKKRDTQVDKLRKNNREEIFSKRRNILIGEPVNNHTESQVIETSRKEKHLIVD